MTALRIARYAFLAGLHDYTSIFTWKSWLAGWYVRVLAQVTFFALIGRLLDSDEQVEFLLLGNAIMVAAHEGIWGLNLALWDRNAGTLQLILASPSSPVLVFAARGTYMIADGTASALGALFVVGPLFGVHFPWPEALLVIPLTILVAASAYFLGTFLAGLIIRWREGNIIVANVGSAFLMTLCGVNVPLDFLPEPLERLAQFLPLTHGLVAIRSLVGDTDWLLIGREASLELAVGLGWLALCLATFTRFLNHGRRDGTLDFAS